jgi:hypothetical protein
MGGWDTLHFLCIRGIARKKRLPETNSTNSKVEPRQGQKARRDGRRAVWRIVGVFFFGTAALRAPWRAGCTNGLSSEEVSYIGMA